MSTGEPYDWTKECEDDDCEIVGDHDHADAEEAPTAKDEFTGFETIRHIVFDVNRRDLLEDPDHMKKLIAEHMKSFPASEFDHINVMMDEWIRLDHNEIRVHMEAKRRDRPGFTVEAIQEVPPV